MKLKLKREMLIKAQKIRAVPKTIGTDAREFKNNHYIHNCMDGSDITVYHTVIEKTSI
jgi:hypothetical protein